MSNAPHGIQPESPLLHYWRVLLKRKYVVVAFTALLTFTVLVASMASTRYYAAKATIEISPKAPVVMDTRQVSDMVPQIIGQLPAYYETQYEIMRSDPVMALAIRKLREEHGVAEFSEPPESTGLKAFFSTLFRSSEEPEEPFSPSPALLRQYLTIRPEPSTHLVHIDIEHPDPKAAALYADTVAQAYMDVNLERSLEASRQALKWLAEQQEVYRLRKQQSDAKVHQFRADKDLLTVDGLVNATAETQQKLQSAWSDAHQRREIAESRFQELSRLQKQNPNALSAYLATDNESLRRVLDHKQDLSLERAKLATTMKEKFPDIEKLDKELRQVEEQVASILTSAVAASRAERDLLAREEERLSQALESTERALRSVDENLIALQSLTSEAERNREFYQDLDKRVTEVGLSQFMQANNIRWVDHATVSKKVVRPQVALNLVSAVLIGIIAGGMIALGMEYLSATIQSREDVELYTHTPLLGVVPTISRSQQKALIHEVDRSIFVYAAPRSNIAECLRTVRTNLMLRGSERPIRSMLITSAAPREGKSFVTANLSTIIAMAGTKVLTIDGDLRRPSLHKRFQLLNDRGFADVLTGEISLTEAIQHTHVPGLHVLVSGEAPINPSEALVMERLRAILKEAGELYDFILIDSPPVSVVSDALVFGSLVDTSVFVVESGRTNRTVARQCCDRLREINGELLGVIVNKVDVEQASYSYYYNNDYSYYYSGEGESNRQAGPLT